MFGRIDGPVHSQTSRGKKDMSLTKRQREILTYLATYSEERGYAPSVNEKHTADNGEMVIALIDGTSATVKKFYRERDGRIRLQPANETMNPIYVHENDISIQGIVVGVLRRF